MKPARTQQGMALIFALLGLLALSLGAVALLHSTDSGSRVLGNLGFKQEATVSADRATQTAIAWLSNKDNKALLIADSSATGYYAQAHSTVDATGQHAGVGRELVDWSGDGCLYASGDTTGQCILEARTVVSGANEPLTLRYAIFRLCKTTGAMTAAGNICAQPASAGMGVAADKGSLDYSKPAPLAGTVQGIFYRVLVQAIDARNTTSITETIVQF
jgi:type IV pilus assembly protein PilX